jgi:hypothetical protein
MRAALDPVEAGGHAIQPDRGTGVMECLGGGQRGKLLFQRRHAMRQIVNLVREAGHFGAKSAEDFQL